MANVKISELTAITSSSDLANADIVPIVDSSDSSTKRVALSVLNDFWSEAGIWCTGTNIAYLLTDCVGIGTATPGTDIMFRAQGDSCITGDIKIGGDVCIGGDDLFMNTNTSGYMLVADGTNFNPIAISGDIAIDSSGATTIQATSVDNSMLAGSIANSKLSNSSLSYGGVSVSLGSSDATPAFDLCDATAYKGDSALVTVGTIASGTWQGTAIATGYVVGTLCDKTMASPVLCGTISGNAFLDEDNMSSDSASKVSSQQSIKAYVDSVASGLDLKCSSHAATTANLSAAYDNGSSGVGATLTNNSTQAALSIDGQTMVADERALVKDQSSGAENGIYIVSTVGDASTNWVLTRTTDFDTPTEITSGAFTFVETGSSYADSGWVMTTDGTVTVGTTALSWTQFSGAGQITAGDGMTKSGNTLNVGAGSNLLVSADAVAMCSIVTSLTTVCATNFAGTLATAAQANVTSLGTLSSLTLGGTLSVGDNDITNVGDIAVDTISGDADSNTTIGFPGSDVLTLNTGGSEAVRINSSQNVGIGTTTPDYTLDVAGNVGFDEYIYHNGDTNTFIRFEPDEINIQVGGEKMISMAEGGGGTQADKVTINDNDTDVDFQVKGTSESNLIRTDAANDRVGIGTADPTVELHVQGDTCVTGNIIGTLSTAAQTNITSLGTLTALTVDSICLDGTTIGHTSDTDLMTVADGLLTVTGCLNVSNNVYTNSIRRYSDSSTTTKILLNDEVIKINAGHSSNEVVKIASGAVTIDGNITGATAICSTNLNASSVYIGGTTSANQLDNYIEGTFTPAYTAGSGSITLSTAEGYYTRIGNLIYVTIKIIASSISSPSGTLVISGLPVTSANNTGGEGIGAVVHKNLIIQTSRSSPYIPFELTGGGTDNIPLTSVRAHAVIRMIANSTTAKLSYVDNDVSYTDAVASDIAADTEIQASFFYQA